jgi:hypothetical protein
MGLYVSAAEPALTEKSVEKDVRNHMPRMRDKRDRQKKRFIDALTAQGTVYHAAQAAGVFSLDRLSLATGSSRVCLSLG